jgi:hypothetical protein
MISNRRKSERKDKIKEEIAVLKENDKWIRRKQSIDDKIDNKIKTMSKDWK